MSAEPSASDLVATCAAGTEEVLATELSALGASRTDVRRGAVAFGGEDPALAYRACLWSRIASRVLHPIGTFTVDSDGALYDGVRAIAWTDHLGPDRTLAVECVAARDVEIDLRYATLKTKDAIVDRIRDEVGRRPDIDRRTPDVRVHVHLDGRSATVSIDLSGGALHRRGYRPERAAAPIKENLAAAILAIAGWRELAATGAPLVDPMCGTGTFLVEAAWIAGDVAPGILRERWGFEGWRAYDPARFRDLVREARERREAGHDRIPTIVGYDASDDAVRAAREALRRARVDDRVVVEKHALGHRAPPPSPRTELPRGLVVTNPPYGERLGDVSELLPLYEKLGDVLRRDHPGFTGWVLTGSPVLARSVGLRPSRRVVLFNGPIECRLLELPIAETRVTGEGGPAWRKPSAESEMLVNRLRKNLRRLERWAKRERVTCYRVYDADIPEYNVAIDLYEGAALVQEYEPPRSIDPGRAARHLRDVLHVVPEVLGVPSELVFVKVRRRQRGGSQYEKRAEAGRERVVHEGDSRFVVELGAYLDTGLFLDHRKLRAIAAEHARGRRFLNLFAYTCTATVHAASAGATSSTSVDLSKTYLGWARRNFDLNRVDPRRHELVHDDCLRWLERARGTWDVALVAPPTTSRSKRMREDFDLQRDHVALLRMVARRISPGGVIFFSTHFRRFDLDAPALSDLSPVDITRQTIPPDFDREPPIHRTWRLTP